MEEKIIGILGGMGPRATLDLAEKIVRCTPIKKEQDHCRIIIDNNPKIESRTDAILSGKTDKIIKQLSETAGNLEKAGADFILLPCNTAHYFLREIRKAVNIEVLDMLEGTAVFISKKYPRLKIAGVLGTPATCGMKLYHRALQAVGIDSLTPDEAGRKKVMTAITMIKEQEGRRRAGIILAAEAKKLVENGAEVVIAGCTEIPLALKEEDITAPLIDPAGILAAKAVGIVKNGAEA
jgi:aspartate racemase